MEDKKREIRFPRIQETYNARTEVSVRVYKYTLRWGLRYLNERHAAKLPPLSVEELQDILLTEIHDKGSHIIQNRSLGKKERLQFITLEKAENIAAEAAEAVLANWIPDYIETQRERGRKGGQKSKRPPTYQPSVLDDLEGLSITEQAARLGCSTATVARLRRKRSSPDYVLSLGNAKHEVEVEIAPITPEQAALYALIQS